MFNEFSYVVVGIVGALVCIGVYELVRRQASAAKRQEVDEQARQLVQGAQREAENLVKDAKLEAKDLVFQATLELEKEQKAKQAELSNAEKRLGQREDQLDRKLGGIEKREQEVQQREQELSKRDEGLARKQAACDQAVKEHREALERVAGMTAEEAKKQLVLEMESQARLEAAGLAKRTLEEAKENAERE
ncbi:MAG: Rnase Y domain-containing protein, partial [Terriglobia bacterium]